MGMTGRVLDGRYEIVGEVGRGGFAFVYQARALRLHDRMVAIKCLRPEYADNEGARTMFRAEIEMFSRLRHANIVQIFDSIETPDNYYVVFELVEGPPDMKRLFLRAREAPDPRYARDYGRRIPPHLAAHIIREVARALDYAHNVEDTSRGTRLNIVHRDISPQNILISFEGDVKLTDFGIAKARDVVTEETSSGVVKGKYSYMSPEQIKTQHLDHTSDLYSLGIVFYEALAGNKLYGADNNDELARMVARGGIPREKLNSTAIPEALRPVLQRALSTDPNHRYQNGSEMVAELSRYLAGRHDLRLELSGYIRALFRPAGQGAAEAGEAGMPGPAVERGGEAPAEPVMLPSGGEDHERTIIDIIRLTAYSGRKFFAIGGAVLAALALVFLGLDTFLGPELFGGRKLGLSEHLYWLFNPPSAYIVTLPPGAEVWVGDEPSPRGRTPGPLGKLDRRSRIRLTLDGYESLLWELATVPGRCDTHAYSFKVPVYVVANVPAQLSWQGREWPNPTPVTDLAKVEICSTTVHEFELATAGFAPIRGSFRTYPPSNHSTQTLRMAPEKDPDGNHYWRVEGRFLGYRRFSTSPADAELILRHEDGTDEPVLRGGSGEYVALAPGRYELRASRASFSPGRREFEISRGDSQDISLTLTRPIRITAFDSETNRRIGSRTLNLGVGTHAVPLSYDGYEKKTERIAVSATSPSEYSFKLTPGAIEVTIRVTRRKEPVRNALVYISQGASLGRT
ncbi:MAG TPA: serine/threonine protein kinase, partial [candidate division WOR-3 bacterium]|nr:serine/threonine protein kinase [candidate division WOR-3 bacterium]